MPRILKMCAAVLVLCALAPVYAAAQQSEPETSATLATGTLNIILANRNGFVIAADSRMSSGNPFSCRGRLQLYCDNSQKLFRTSENSAMVVAGFAVGRSNTPLDFTLAAVLRRTFGTNGLAKAELQGPNPIPDTVDGVTRDALQGVAAIHSPSTPSTNLSVIATFAGFDRGQIPVLQQMVLRESWVSIGPLNVPVPRYTRTLTPPLSITRFTPVPVGISFVAEAILSGLYRSDDAVIKGYYQRLKSGELDDMPLSQMAALTLVILRETRKLTDYVGGEDQVGVFPVGGSPIFYLPSELGAEMQSAPKIIRWEGLLCSIDQTPRCGNAPPFSFSLNVAQAAADIPFSKFLLASEFKNIPVSLDGNLFVADTFEGVTLKWRGQPFFSYRNTFKDCLLELSVDAQLGRYPELAACRVVRKSSIDLPAGTVGLPIDAIQGPGGDFALFSSGTQP